MACFRTLGVCKQQVLMKQDKRFLCELFPFMWCRINEKFQPVLLFLSVGFSHLKAKGK